MKPKRTITKFGFEGVEPQVSKSKTKPPNVSMLHKMGTLISVLTVNCLISKKISLSALDYAYRFYTWTRPLTKARALFETYFIFYLDIKGRKIDNLLSSRIFISSPDSFLE